jgi:hypothetical protein
MDTFAQKLHQPISNWDQGYGLGSKQWQIWCHLKKACISYQHHVFFSINLEKATRNPDSERINAAKDIKG